MFVEKTETEGMQGLSIGSGFYKARLAVKSKGKGKRGGLRVIAHKEIILSVDAEEIILIVIYDKNEITSIDMKYLDMLIKKYK